MEIMMNVTEADNVYINIENQRVPLKIERNVLQLKYLRLLRERDEETDHTKRAFINSEIEAARSKCKEMDKQLNRMKKDITKIRPLVSTSFDKEFLHTARRVLPKDMFEMVMKATKQQIELKMSTNGIQNVSFLQNKTY
jgi:hypothetical protein